LSSTDDFNIKTNNTHWQWNNTILGIINDGEVKPETEDYFILKDSESSKVMTAVSKGCKGPTIKLQGKFVKNKSVKNQSMIVFYHYIF
jgi:hypothetical protein